MTRQRFALYALLLVVAAAAAVLSFSALRDLALVCGFAPELAWLLPVTVDAGAAAASIVWLARTIPVGARTYGRTFAIVLLSSSVVGNALGHGLHAFGLSPAWWVVVGVSAIAPAVLGALVHLVVLVGRVEPSEPDVVDVAAHDPRPERVPTPLPLAPDGPDVEQQSEPVKANDEQILTELRATVGPLPSNYEVRKRYGMGDHRADRLLGVVAGERAEQSGRLHAVREVTR